LWFDRHPALAFCLSMIFSENRIPPPDQVRGKLFPDHALDLPNHSAKRPINPALLHDSVALLRHCVLRT
jgi:hypothetical protein